MLFKKKTSLHIVLHVQTFFLVAAIKIGLGLWCLMPLSTIYQLYRGSQFYWWRKPEYPQKTTDLSHNVVHLD
jgi:hypothetical protein